MRIAKSAASQSRSISKWKLASWWDFRREHSDRPEIAVQKKTKQDRREAREEDSGNGGSYKSKTKAPIRRLAFPGKANQDARPNCGLAITKANPRAPIEKTGALREIKTKDARPKGGRYKPTPFRALHMARDTCRAASCWPLRRRSLLPLPGRTSASVLGDTTH